MTMGIEIDKHTGIIKGVGKSSWLPDKVKSGYLQQGKKILLIGSRGCGKTTFIKQRVIPNIKGSYQAIDFCGEYDDLPRHHVIRMPDNGNDAKYKECLIRISNEYGHIPIIADSLMCLGGIGFGDWFEEAFKDKTLIAVMHDLKSIHSLNFPWHMFDAFVIFRTHDDPRDIVAFIQANAISGKFTSCVDLGSKSFH